MAVRWASVANLDLIRLHAFLEAVDPEAASDAVELLLAGARRIAKHPRLGPRLPGFHDREVRRVIVGDYEMRYELREHDIIVLRLWHVPEDR